MTVFCCVSPLRDTIHLIIEQFEETRSVCDKCVKGDECKDPVHMEEVVDNDRFSSAMLVETPICCAELCTLFHGISESFLHSLSMTKKLLKM